MNKYVCEILTKEELENIFDQPAIEVIQYLLEAHCFSTINKHPNNQEQDSLDIPQESFEKWVQQAIGGKRVGAGSRAIDFIQEDQYIADIKSVTANYNIKTETFEDNYSGESSLAQKFSKNGGNNLDLLINEGKFNEIKELWLNLYKNKINEEFKLNPKCKSFYYFWFIKTKPMKYLCLVGFRINLNHLENVEIKEGQGKEEIELTSLKKDTKSVFLNNFVDSNHGNVKIYSSKKRLEMRLKVHNLVNHMIKIPIDFKNEEIDLRKEIIEKGKKQLLIDKINKIYQNLIKK